MSSSRTFSGVFPCRFHPLIDDVIHEKTIILFPKLAIFTARYWQPPAALPVIASNKRGEQSNPRVDVNSAAVSCQYLAVKMAANAEAVSA
jgi:hypothetical protein